MPALTRIPPHGFQIELVFLDFDFDIARGNNLSHWDKLSSLRKTFWGLRPSLSGDSHSQLWIGSDERRGLIYKGLN